MVLGYILVVIYAICLSAILVYSMAQAHLTWVYLRAKRSREDQQLPLLPTELPFVTVQLPVYNELYVVERLIRKVAQLDYPLHRWEIQVLDDSTDEGVEVAARIIQELQGTGLNIQHIRRADRVGFKAGALSYGMTLAKGEFIAIFDADFLPEKDFLQRTLPYFSDPGIGMVQTRWEHLNRNYNLLTRLLSMALDAHFTIEQKGRNANGDFMNFNGTAGVWRRTCIESSGGWSADTLTEDLDLSYRAQLKGWRMKYVEEFTSPAEVPAFLSAIRSQQYRWNKGGAEVARKNLKAILRSRLPFHVKFHALFHLLNTGVFIFIFVSSVLSVPLLYFIAQGHVSDLVQTSFGVFLIGFLLLSIFYWVSLRQRHENAWSTTLTFLLYFPVFLGLSMGLSLFNTIAVLEGYAGIRTPFVRTPKFNIIGKGSEVKKNRYMHAKIPLIAVFEGLLACYFAFAVWYAWQHGLNSFIPYHILLAIGFGGIFFYSVRHSMVRV